MSNITFEPDDKSLAERQLMEELERGERSGEVQGSIDLNESRTRLRI